MLETLLVVVPLMLSPGPANATSLLLGARYSMWELLPFHAGIMVIYAVVSIGIGAVGNRIAEASPATSAALPILGGLFIVYLGVRLLRHKASNAAARRPTLRNGVALQLLNPKFPGVVLSVFATQQTQPLAIIVLTICSVGAVGLIAYAWAGSLLARGAGLDRDNGPLEAVSGGMLCVVGLWFAMQPVFALGAARPG